MNWTRKVTGTLADCIRQLRNAANEVEDPAEKVQMQEAVAALDGVAETGHIYGTASVTAVISGQAEVDEVDSLDREGQKDRLTTGGLTIDLTWEVRTELPRQE